MIDALKKHLEGTPAGGQLNRLREYLQRLLLQGIDETGYRKTLVFTGGTALRIVYGIRRFSEDLDFSLAISKGFEANKLASGLKRALDKRGLSVGIHQFKTVKTVASFFVRFEGLLYALDLTPNKDQKLSIKVEIDQNPPHGGVIEETLLQDPSMFLTNHFDLSSLFATKLHAVLFRPYTKGRDYYDLHYYLGKKVKPNFKLFQNAARQTHLERKFPTVAALTSALRLKIESLHDEKLLQDIRPFLEDSTEARYMSKTLLLKALEQNPLD